MHRSQDEVEIQLQASKGVHLWLVVLVTSIGHLWQIYQTFSAILFGLPYSSGATTINLLNPVEMRCINFPP